MKSQTEWSPLSWLNNVFMHILRLWTVRRTVWLVAIMLSLSIIGYFGGKGIYAMSGYYWDNTSDMTGGGTTMLVVGETANVHEAEVNVRVYFPTDNGYLYVDGYNFCPKDTSNNDYTGDASPGADSLTKADGTVTTNYSITYGSTPTTSTAQGKLYKGTADGHCDGAGAGNRLTFHLTGLTLDDSGLYSAKLRVTHSDVFPGLYDGIENYFQLSSSAGGTISHAGAGANGSTANGYDVTMQDFLGTATSVYKSFTVKFGSDCSVTANTPAFLNFYDLDNDGSLNPTDAQYGKKITMQLTQITPTGVSSVIPLAGSTTWTPNTLKNISQSAQFIAQPGMRYELKMNDVYYNNVVQFSTPYDGIYYEHPCLPFTSTCNAPSLGAVSPGTHLTFGVGVTLDRNFGPPLVKNVNPTMSVDIKNGATTVYGPSATNYSTSGKTITSDPVNYTVGSAGTYTVRWILAGSVSTTCTTTFTVKNQPFFSVVGGDIMAGTTVADTTGVCATSGSAGNITGLNSGSSAYAGAGGEVGAWATGTIKNFVSGRGLSEFATQSGHGISFANTSAMSPGNYGGNYGQLPCTPDYYAKAFGGGFPGFASITDGGTHDYKVTGPFTLTGGTLAAGNVVDLYVDGDVTINGDITYGAYNLSNVPRFNLIVSGTIYIAPAVSTLHGVYVAESNSGGTAKGDIVTCGVSGTTTVTYDQCKDNPLHMYGAVYAEGLMKMTRTSGTFASDGSNPGTPAETFEYVPELWLYRSGQANLEDMSYVNLPPIL